MKIEARWLFVRDVGGPPSPSGLLGGEGRPAQLPYCRQAGSNSVTFASAPTQEKSRNSPELLCNLPFGVWNLRLPQFDRISLRVMQAAEPPVGIRLRVNL